MVAPPPGVGEVDAVLPAGSLARVRQRRWADGGDARRGRGWIRWRGEEQEQRENGRGTRVN
jgi:hypothetical protein